MAGLVQLEATGLQDKYFTDDPEYTYFIKNFKRHTNYSKSFIDIDPSGEVDFGQVARFTIPPNIGDLIKTISVKMTLPAISSGICYVESIGHALIERVDLLIGGEVIQSIPSDYLQIHSEQNITQTKQWALNNMIGKYPNKRAAGVRNSNSSIISSLGSATSDRKCFVDIPFYFLNNPELSIPLCAITKQEIEVEIKLRDLSELLVDTSGLLITTPVNASIKDFKLNCEIVFLDNEERKMIRNRKIDYTITQIQQNIFSIPLGMDEFKCKTSFINPVKEMYFIIQRENKKTASDFVYPFDYDNLSFSQNNKMILYEQLKHLTLHLNTEEVINETTGNYIFLKAVQSAIHHSRCQLMRRFYSYSFSLEPEKHYPTGQVNFSLVKDQIINLSLNESAAHSREFRVYALSYNILRVSEGFAKTIFNS